jgi:hypothetical protein
MLAKSSPPCPNHPTPVPSRRLIPQIDTLASMSSLPEGRRVGGPSMGLGEHEGGASGHSQHQHSLFVVRAAWSTLRRALMALQEAVAASLDVSSNPAVAYLQVIREQAGGYVNGGLTTYRPEGDGP